MASRLDSLGERSGWISFALAMMTLAGALNIMDGLVALTSSKFYSSHAVYVFSDLRTWGWIVLGIGTLQVLAAFSLTGGSQWARWFGIAIAGVNAVAQLMFVQSYPFWSLAIFAIDVLVIYGLTAYGSREAIETR